MQLHEMNCDFITPTLAVGQKINTQEFADALKAAGVTHVINLWSGISEPYWVGDVLTLKQDDDGTPRRKDQVLAGVAYAATVPEGQVLYVHCQWGIARAPAMAYAILRSRGMAGDEAAKLIITQRPKATGLEQYIPSVEDTLKGLEWRKQNPQICPECKTCLSYERDLTPEEVAGATQVRLQMEKEWETL